MREIETTSWKRRTVEGSNQREGYNQRTQRSNGRRKGKRKPSVEDDGRRAVKIDTSKELSEGCSDEMSCRRSEKRKKTESINKEKHPELTLITTNGRRRMGTGMKTHLETGFSNLYFNQIMNIFYIDNLIYQVSDLFEGSSS